MQVEIIKLKKNTLNIVLLICLSTKILVAQEAHFSQYFTLPLLTNPAYAGIHNQSKVGLIYRNQYNALPSSYISYGVCYDTYVPGIHGGVSLEVVKDDVGNGILQNQHAGFSYAYQNAINKKIAFSFGMEALCNFNFINFSKIVVYNMLIQQTCDVIQSLQNVENFNAPNSKIFIDVNAGGVIFNDNFYAGIGMSHLTKPNDAWVGNHIIPILLNIQAGYLFRPKDAKKRNDSWYFSPNIYFLNQQNMHEINFTALAGLGYAQAGIGYRNSSNSDAMIFHLAFLNGIFRIGYSYDFNISTKYFQPRNAHEISIQYIFKHNKSGVGENDWGRNETNNRKKRIKCPNFFR